MRTVLAKAIMFCCPKLSLLLSMHWGKALGQQPHQQLQQPEMLGCLLLLAPLLQLKKPVCVSHFLFV